MLSRELQQSRDLQARVCPDRHAPQLPRLTCTVASTLQPPLGSSTPALPHSTPLGPHLKSRMRKRGDSASAADTLVSCAPPEPAGMESKHDGGLRLWLVGRRTGRRAICIEGCCTSQVRKCTSGSHLIALQLICRLDQSDEETPPGASCLPSHWPTGPPTHPTCCPAVCPRCCRCGSGWLCWVGVPAAAAAPRTNPAAAALAAPAAAPAPVSGLPPPLLPPPPQRRRLDLGVAVCPVCCWQCSPLCLPHLRNCKGAMRQGSRVQSEGNNAGQRPAPAEHSPLPSCRRSLHFKSTGDARPTNRSHERLGPLPATHPLAIPPTLPTCQRRGTPTG